MKKNKMMRNTAALGVAVLLTASVLSGTLAKYTTTAEGTDSARVAKWGIVMNSTGSSTFKDSYDSSVATSKAGEKIVAPGTSGSAIYAVTGTPETAYEITFKGSSENDVYLENGLAYSYAGTDVKYTKPDGSPVERAYYPVNYSVKIKHTGSGDAKISKAGTEENAVSINALNTVQTFETLEAAMKALSNTQVTYDTPNTAADLTVELKWAWQFDKDTNTNSIKVSGGHEPNDAYDTVLGDIIAKNTDLTIDGQKVSAMTPAVADKYSTQIGYTLQMTATQVD